MRPAGAWLCVMLTLACAGGAQARSAAETMDILMWNREPVGGPFELLDHTGTPRSDRDFRGRLMLIYFGFTYCPDICPTDLMAIGQALDQLGPDADAVQPVFITLDPERDTTEHLAEFVPVFHPRLLGLTGSLDAIGTVAEAYRVYFAKIPVGKDGGDYTIDHTSFIYLMDRDGKYLGFFPPGTSAERMVEIIRPRLAPPSR